MRTEYFLFVHQATSIFAKLSTWCFEHSGDISCCLVVSPSHTDDSWEGQNLCLSIYSKNLFIEHSGEHWLEQNIVCSFYHTITILAKLSTSCFKHSGKISCSLLVNLSHTDGSSEGRNTCLWIYVWVYSLSILENTDENRIFFVRSQRQKYFGNAEHLVFWTHWWHQLFSTH